MYNETVIYIIQQPHQLEWETVMQLDATTEQNADLDPEWLALRTTLHVVYAGTINQTLTSTIVAKVPALIRQWAAELLKKADRFLH